MGPNFSICDGKGKILYDALNILTKARGLSNNRLTAVSANGASSMVGNENGFVTLLKKDVPNLVGIHCIVHREALVVADAAKKVPELLYVEKLANKVYSWIQNST